MKIIHNCSNELRCIHALHDVHTLLCFFLRKVTMARNDISPSIAQGTFEPCFMTRYRFHGVWLLASSCPRMFSWYWCGIMLAKLAGMPTHAVMDVVELLLYVHLCLTHLDTIYRVCPIQFAPIRGFCSVYHVKFRWITWGVALIFHERFCDNVALVSCRVEIDVGVWVVWVAWVHCYGHQQGVGRSFWMLDWRGGNVIVFLRELLWRILVVRIGSYVAQTRN